jgi:hypothetical protein
MFDDRSTMREARARYFAQHGFGADGGYDDRWVHLALGPIPASFPNSPARVRAVKYHDLHHIVTGYATDIVGEFEISAWEIGAGCKDFVAAWVLNLGGMAGGAVTAPRRTLRAFARGRRSRSLYGRAFEPLLEERVASVRTQLGLDAAATKLTVGTFLRFVGAVLAGVVVALALIGPSLLIAPLLVGLGLRKRGSVPMPT